MAQVPQWSRRSRFLLALGLVSALAEVTFGRSRQPGIGLAALYGITALATVVVMILVVAKGKPWGRPAWVIFSAVLLLHLLGVTYRGIFQQGLPSADLSSVAGADYFYAAAYGMSLVALIYLIRNVRRRPEPLWQLDTAIVFVSLWSVGAVLILTGMHDRVGFGTPFWIQAFYLTVDAALASLGVRLVMTTSPATNRGLRLALLALVVFVLNDLESTAFIVAGTPNGIRDGIYLALNTMAIASIGAGVGDSTIRNAPAATPHEGRLSPWRSVAVTLTVIAAVTVVVGERSRVPGTSLWVPAIAVGLLTLLLAARSGVMVRTYREAMDLEERLRRAGDAINAAGDQPHPQRVTVELQNGLREILPGEHATSDWHPEGDLQPCVAEPLGENQYRYRTVVQAGDVRLKVELDSQLMLDPRDWNAVTALTNVALEARLRQQLRIEREEATETARLTTLMAGAQDMVVLLDRNHRIHMAVGAVEALTSRPAQWWQGRGLDDLLVDPSEALVAARESDVSRTRLESQIGPSGALVELTVAHFAGGEVSVALHNVTERVRMTATLEQQATHDALTGLANRMRLNEILAEAERRWQNKGQPFSVVFVDIDDFKVVNDSMGHRFGDALLVALADRLQHVVADRGVVARLGGDEFAVVSNCESEEGLHIANDVVADLSAPVEVEGVEIVVRASAGVATSEVAEDTGELLLQAADLALYDARSRGKGSVAAFHTELRDDAVRRLREVNAVTDAARDNAFHFNFQPIVSLDADQRPTVIALEALMRWRGNSEFTGPDTFIPIAESLGELTSIIRRLLPEALEDLARWRRTSPSLTLAVNMHAAAMLDEDFDDWILATLAASNLPTSALVIEISERALVPDQAVRNLAILRDRGVAVWIDDFGTGWSNLSYLDQLPVTGVKLARELVCTPDGGVKRNLVHAVVSLAEAIGFTVIAEGIETSEQAETLRELGVTEVQGYLVARPMPGADIPAWLLDTTHD